MAKEGLTNVLDFFTRDMQSRNKVFFAVAKDVQARQILDYDDKTEQIPSIGLSNYKNVLFRNSGSVYKTVLDFNQSILSHGSNPVLGVFSLSPKMDDQPDGSDTQGNEYQFAGSAVFNYDSLQGFLSPEETEAYNFAAGNINNAEIDINGLKNTDTLISTQVIHESSSIVPYFDGSQISFDINIQDTAIIGEVHDETDVTDLGAIAVLENENFYKIYEAMGNNQDRLASDFP